MNTPAHKANPVKSVERQGVKTPESFGGFGVSFGARRGIISFDPRTKLLVILFLNTIVVSKFSITALCLFGSIALVLLLLSKLWRAAAAVIVFIAFFFTLFRWAVTIPVPWLASLLANTGFYMLMMSVTFASAIWFLQTTKPGEYMAALKAIRFPDAIVFPTVVLFRFLPTIRDEAVAIRQALKLRGLTGPWAVITHPVRAIENILVPLFTIVLTTGDELTASATVRGMGNKCRKTSHTRISFTVWDALLLTVIIGSVAWYLVSVGARQTIGI